MEERGGRELLTITGVVDSVIYKSDDSGYTVIDVEADNGDFLTAVGIMPHVGEGEAVRLYGYWTTHASFGEQFRVESAEACLPAGAVEIERYLASGAVHGIGPVTAKRIVEMYGEDSFDVIENHPDWLAEVNGISKKRAKEIHDSFVEGTGSRSVMMFCRDFFGPATSMRIYKEWGAAAVDMIKENPYRLCGEIYGVGFEKADEIALSLGVARDSDKRVEGAAAYILSRNASLHGHVFLPRASLVGGVSELLSIGEKPAEDAVSRMAAKRKIYIEEVEVSGRTVEACYLDTYYRAECEIARRLRVLDRMCPAIGEGDVERFIKLLELRHNIEYAEAQKKAMTDALSCGVMVLTGSPGTGKTTVIKGLLEIFRLLGSGNIELAAPTGRAAKRMSEATGEDARTIHRLLEMEYNESAYPRFTKDEHNRLDADVIIIDESSMIDIMLMESLLRAIKPGSRLILIGDSNQLPSVGAGSVLWDLISSGVVRTVCLHEIFRQANESSIITNAALINEGRYPVLTEKKSDFFFLPRRTDIGIRDTVVELCARRLPAAYGDEISAGIQVITPSRKGAAGTEVLNSALQAELNPPASGKRERKVRDITFREGDRVMQTRNNYKLGWYRDGEIQLGDEDEPDGIGVFNGDIGVIEKIEPEHERMVILFDDRRVFYDFSLLDELEHAFAITVHKSQGSEYPVVIIPIYNCPEKLRTRHMLYTAITRASRMAILVGREDIIRQMVDSVSDDKKYTALSWRLRREFLSGGGE